ncbi:hypothetical protein J6590_028448 [Homalodisca vitripennis]|nr:hypothetical protein J6590_028448 [Homalodisca vitripennis]
MSPCREQQEMEMGPRDEEECQEPNTCRNFDSFLQELDKMCSWRINHQSLLHQYVNFS